MDSEMVMEVPDTPERASSTRGIDDKTSSSNHYLEPAVRTYSRQMKNSALHGFNGNGITPEDNDFLFSQARIARGIPEIPDNETDPKMIDLSEDTPIRCWSSRNKEEEKHLSGQRERNQITGYGKLGLRSSASMEFLRKAKHIAGNSKDIISSSNTNEAQNPKFQKTTVQKLNSQAANEQRNSSNHDTDEGAGAGVGKVSRPITRSTDLRSEELVLRLKNMGHKRLVRNGCISPSNVARYKNDAKDKGIDEGNAVSSEKHDSNSFQPVHRMRSEGRTADRGKGKEVMNDEFLGTSQLVVARPPYRRFLLSMRSSFLLKKTVSSLHLSDIPTEGEIFNALKDINPNKAPGPDGFTPAFYITCWDIIKKEVVMAIQSFFNGDDLCKYFSVALIVLIPKGRDKSHWYNFRPISLTTIISKVISKILVARIQPYLNSIISPHQSAFIKKREITDNILLTQELLDELDRKCRGGNLVMKLDIKKAFDTIHWDFIIKVLSARGFHNNFCNLILRWLSNNFYSVLVNGSSYGFFSAQRGIKQGDPLSPIIFILAFDYLSGMLNLYQTQHSHIRYSHRAHCLVSHLAYADDIIVFSNASKPAIKKLMHVLEKFENLSGLSFNRDKCYLYFTKHLSHIHTNWATSYTGFKLASLPLKYLGVNLIRGRCKQIQMDEVIDKIQGRIQDWKNTFLSTGGRLTLLSAVLHSIPLYALQVFNAKKSSIRMLEGIFNRFLWEGGGAKKHWLSWRKLCKPKFYGGLGFKALSHIVEINMCKLWYKFRLGDSLWANFMHSKYCSSAHPSTVLWKVGDSKIWKAILGARAFARDCFLWDLGDGRVSFWNDCWGVPQLDLIPHHPQHDNMLVADCWLHGHWDLPKLRELVGNDVAMLINQIPLQDTHRDKPLWRKTPLSVSKYIYNSITSHTKWQWGNTLWQPLFTPSMSFFLWRLFSSLLPLDDILKLKGLRMASICLFCKQNEESYHHIFFNCSYTKDIWKMLANVFNLVWPSCCSIENFLNVWKNVTLADKPLRHFPLVVLWFVWMARNSFKHTDEHPTPFVTFSRIWAYYHKAIKSFSPNSEFHSISRPVLVRWLPPIPGWIKLNIDGCWSLNFSGAGGLFRDHLGNLLCFFSFPVVADTPLCAEAWALLLALRTAVCFNFTYIQVETDSQVLINLFYKNTPLPRTIVYLFRRIWHTITTSFMQVNLTFIYREGNSPADWLAKYALDRPLVGTEPSRPLSLLIHSDLLDLPYIRR